MGVFFTYTCQEATRMPAAFVVEGILTLKLVKQSSYVHTYKFYFIFTYVQILLTFVKENLGYYHSISTILTEINFHLFHPFLSLRLEWEVYCFH